MMDLYEFEFKFMPFLIEECSSRKLDPRSLVEKDFIKMTVEQNTETVAWNWDDFEIKVEDTGDIPVIIYRFPEPDAAPLARFGAVVVNHDGLAYYTLEFENYSNKVSWHFCTMNHGEHRNLGKVHECTTTEEFAALIEKRVLKIRTPKQKSLFVRIVDFFKR